MRGIAIALGLCAACGGKKDPPRATTHDAKPATSAVVIDAAPPAPDAATRRFTQAELDDRYARATARANEPEGLTILAEIARVHGGDALDRARGDDAWAQRWQDPAFRALVLLAPELPDDADEPDPSEPPVLACPGGTRHTGKWDVATTGKGKVWCARPNGTRHGPFHMHEQGYDDGEGWRESRGEYIDGKKHGLWESYESFGERASGAYVRDVPHGLWVHEDDSGDVRLDVYVDGKLDGLVTEHDRQWLTREQWYRRGVMHGAYRSWYDGKLWEEGAYDDGKKSGEWKHYEEGRLAQRGHYDAGVPHGVFTWYDAAGGVIGESTLDHGTGTWIEVALHKKTEEGPLVRGKRDGEWTYWLSDLRQATGRFRADKLDGEWRIYGDDGTTVEQRVVWNNDRLVSVDGKKATADHRTSPEQFREAPDLVEEIPDEDYY